MTRGIFAPRLACDFVAGVDLGQSADHSAIVVVKRSLRELEPIDRATYQYACRREHAIVYIQRLPLDRPYSELVARVFDVDQSLRARSDPGADAPRWFVDRGGPGAPVCDSLRDRLSSRLFSVFFSGGEDVTWPKGRQYPNVPKVLLVSGLTADLQNGAQAHGVSCPHDAAPATFTLVVADACAYREELERELLGMAARRTAAGRVVMEASSAPHDDLVMSAGLANFGARWLSLDFPRHGKRLL